MAEARLVYTAADVNYLLQAQDQLHFLQHQLELLQTAALQIYRRDPDIDFLAALHE